MASSSSPERGLQEELKDAGNRLLTTPSSTHELLSLLDKLEHLLSRVEQAPSKSMRDALRPLMKALTAQNLLRHSDIDVKVSVVSCINEIMRVTAPDAPFDDEPMKEIFELTVMALEKLSLASGRCYTKAVSILATFATVRSCLVMLDLECDELIVEMFQLFLNATRFDHPHSVLSDMETIMTTVIEESEEIPLELLIPLLSSVKKENKNVSPLSWKLGENVIRKCATKLKPYLPPAVQFMRVNLNDFAEIVLSICLDASGREHAKAVPFSANRSLNKNESPLEEASKEKCKRKRTPRKEEVCEMTSDTKNHGEELVGCQIKVWWPLDHRFYEGAIYSFDPIERKHRVLYADGDEETLDLSKERWILVGKSKIPEQGQETESTDLPSSDALSDMPQKKKVKTRSECSTKQKHAAPSSESGGASGGESKVEAQNAAANPRLKRV
ncbi:Sister chromatid cohesion protein like [Actinidia chinensis var. chinensis]|uniref:Sister chromatid cohesion protein like n=1 Tax=Actinidia chinensis var. chinensis TaxID=1590841 RepID=A0A2R6PDG0_ACTCC|nr:Sister chromatid cohesion protein like [Actinidia chinensis var. chinensis]